MKKEENSKLFEKFEAKRDEPRVVASDWSVVPTGDTDVNEFQDYKNELSLLREMLSLIKKDYAKILKILIDRANSLGISLDVESLVIKDNSLSNALLVLFGNSKIKKINFQKYIDMLTYEQSLVAAHVAISANIDDALSEVVDNSKDTLLQSDIIKSIGIIKGLFNDVISKSKYPTLVLASDIVTKIAKTNSTLSSIDMLESDTKSDNTDDKSSKWRNALYDCIPCAEGAFASQGEFFKSMSLKKYLDTLWRVVSGSLNDLMALKLNITGNAFSQNICDIMKMFGRDMCIPDLMVLASLFVLMMSKVKRMLNAKLNNQFNALKDLSYSIVSTLVASTLDAISAMLIQIMNYALSPAECILSSIQTQLGHLYLGDEHLSKINKLEADKKEEIYRYGRQGVDYITQMVDKTIKDILKMKGTQVAESKEILDINKELQTVSDYLSLIKEFIQVKKLYDLTEGGFFERLGKSICLNALNASRPWIIPDKAYNPSNSNSTDPNTTPVQRGNPSNNSGDITIEGRTYFTIEDPTVTADIFNDDPIDKINESNISSKIKNIKDTEDIANGKSPLSLDLKLLEEYLFHKQSLMEFYNSKSFGLSDVKFSGLPIIRLDTSGCQRQSNIPNLSESERKQWVNKIISTS